jgi:hypothetical protein
MSVAIIYLHIQVEQPKRGRHPHCPASFQPQEVERAIVMSFSDFLLE